jgi:hypothetical protein
MDTETGKVYRNIGDIPKDRLEHCIEVPDYLVEDAKAVLKDKDESVAESSTKSGKKLLEFAAKVKEKKKRRKRNKAARRARRK